MKIRKMRLDRGWSQETLAELTGLSVRTVQRIERGGNASLETLSALASVFEVDITTLAKETSMYTQHELPEAERNALEYARDIKGFYSHLAVYAVSVAGMAAANYLMTPEHIWFLWSAIGWGLGVATHGLAAFEVISVFGPRWEKRKVDERLRNDEG
ncbi:MAG: helix-turn-helix domain-containing protein [Pseudomonadota bacterium]